VSSWERVGREKTNQSPSLHFIITTTTTLHIFNRMKQITRRILQWTEYRIDLTLQNFGESLKTFVQEGW
jgi:hypothetical protein